MEMHELLGAPTAALEDMLAEREARAATQRRLLSGGGNGLVCLSMNMAGPVKDFPLLRQAFQEGCRLTETALQQTNIDFCLMEERQGKCGPCAFYRIDGDLEKVKIVLCSVEETPNLGRLLDLDVLAPDGRKLSRQELGCLPRRCLICNGEAVVCGRSRRHSVEELQRETLRRLRVYFGEKWADEVASCCARAMLYEVAVTPKPGLVDRRNSGAHHDMDFFTFIDSTAALTPWFRRFYLLGFHEADFTDDALFDKARKLGCQAEEAMFAATSGINTHKGLIFSLGLLCTAAGRLCRGNPPTGYVPSTLVRLLLKEASALAACSLPLLERGNTHGSEVCKRYGARGIRQEAADGFPSVVRWVLPKLHEKEGTLEERGKQALLELFASVEDTNVLHRGGPAALTSLSQRAKSLLAGKAPVSDAVLTDFDDALIQDNISPGGCADLLAVGYFLLFFEKL